MQYIQEITLDIHQHGYVSVNAKQGDQNGRFIRIHLTNNGEEIKLEDGESVEFRALKPDGKSIDNPATIEEGGTILACLTDQTLAVDGEVIADIAIKQGTDVVSTLNFVIDVQKAPLGEDIPSTNEFGTLTKATEDAVSATNRANDAAGLIEGMTVSASKVAAGGTPTAKLTTDGDHYNLALGLVTGDKGAKGDKGDTPTIEVAETVTGAPGDPAKVENVGTPTDPKLKFTIPLGNQGPVSSVNGGTGDVVIGERNLLLKSGKSVSNSNYNIANYYFGGEHPLTGETYTVVIKLSKVPSGKTSVLFTNSGGFVPFGPVSISGPGIYSCTHDWVSESSGYVGDNTFLGVFMRPSTVGGESTIDWIKMVKGNSALYDWSPAPEDKADVPMQFDISLPASGWANGSQTVTDARFIAGDYDWDVDVKGACIPWDGITITEGQMTVKADIVPAADMTWTVTRWEVRRDG